MNLRVRPGVHLTATEDGAVLLDERTATYWQVNHTAAEILAGLGRDGWRSRVMADLARRYHAPITLVARDVATFIAALTRHGLIERR